MTQPHPLLLSAPILTLSFATLIAQGDPPASGLRPTAAGSSPASLAKVLVDDAAVVSPPKQAAPLAPASGQARGFAEEALAARVSAALTGSPTSASPERRVASRRQGRVAVQPEAGVAAPGAGADRAWVCGAWVELWQGSGRGKDCSWAPRGDAR